MSLQKHSKALLYYTVFAALGSVLTLVALSLDGRILAGEPVWLKPLKFFLSTLIFVPTFEFVLSKIEGPYQRINFIRRGVAAGLLFEMLIICGQAFRGVKSHFNQSTTLDSILFTAMGVVISFVVLLVGLGAVTALRFKFRGSRALQQAAGWGFLVFVVAAFLGAAMPRPTPSQLAMIENGERPITIGSHFVGSEEGATKVAPVTAWSLESGDLRVAHFVGMHVPQALLALVFLMRMRRWNLNSKPAANLVRFGAAIGFLLMALTFVQAQVGQSVFVLNSQMGLANLGALLGFVVLFLRAASGQAERGQL